MRRKEWPGVLLGLAVLTMAGAVPVLASETQTEDQGTGIQETETELQEAGTEETGEAVILSVDGEDIAIKNETGSQNLGVEAEHAEISDSESDAETTDSEADADSTETASAEEAVWTVTFSGDDGEEHVFSSVDPGEWADAVLTENYGFWYLQYTSENGETKELEETAEEKALDEELTMWTLTDVYVRESADSEAQAIKVASLGDECTVTAALPGWFQVEYDGVTGYIRYKYLTDDKSASEAAVEQEQSARAAEQAAAAAQAYSSSGSGSGGSSSGGGGGSSQQECLENGLLN